ncbi:bi-domain-containing oxidoreductase [uncultured Parvibaculum sp.]|uniref:bi-domain-containing oxidoreductase n=1 Tax=uncultured Parvibaculum sp. TaxID=291828 RepID=UPI0030D7F82A|tara:strand:- start:8851 stop:10992 length:2142 start_codon:yes stop_codon:yes gene_type:complete
MKQLLQSLKNGTIELADVPAPRGAARRLLIRTAASLVSAGTERMLVEFGQANWFDKARQQPDKVRMVLDKARTDGLAATFEAVQSKLDQPLAPGYCNVGRVAEVGAGVVGFSIGDRVASNGRHAEIVSVPLNLCARIPDGVSDEQAAFTVLAAIGLQGIRLAAPTLGECVVVTGLGLIGLLTVQMLKAQGCRVLGIDFNEARLALARQFGAETVNPGAGGDVLAAAQAFSRGRGVDAVIITASTKSDEPVHQAAQICRQRGRIVLVGVTGLKLSRADFYEKELSFQVSCSYGPGRYDPAYEEGGQDYPVGFVRWTEQRNFEAALDMMAAGTLDVAPLISHRFPLAAAPEAYALLSSGAPSLGILLQYPGADAAEREAPPARQVALGPRAAAPGKAGVGFLGAGNYAGRVLIPAFKAAGASLQTVVSAGGVSAVHFGRKYGFAAAATDSAAALADPAVDTVVIATRHDAHGAQVLAAFRAGKHVFCEKPLCLTLAELEAIEAEAVARPAQLLMLGFNRRFAPQAIRIKSLLDQVAEPKSFIMTVNAGAIPADHWTQARAVGGGRIVGEACHFIDLLRHLAGAPILRHHAVALGRHPALAIRDDKAVITLEFADGSVGTIHYLANGDKGFPKERLEVFAAGRVLQLDNFRRLRGWGWKGFSRMNLWRQDKGQGACAKAFVEAVRAGGPAPIPAAEIFEVSRATIEIAASLADGSC